MKTFVLTKIIQVEAESIPEACKIAGWPLAEIKVYIIEKGKVREPRTCDWIPKLKK